ncbi:hypothetical protein [Xenorhabdus thailandensis]|uniref:hypothetical protein n=1 Tax=Xenorhabdus thailandensis TaxID=3136255 RepID=UPI0030F48304
MPWFITRNKRFGLSLSYRQAERQQVLVTSTPLKPISRKMQFIHHLFETQAAHHPDTIAVVFVWQNAELW